MIRFKSATLVIEIFDAVRILVIFYFLGQFLWEILES
jgi:hypothetical protein